MEELLGQKVKIAFNSQSGFVSLVGTFIRANDHFVLIETTSGGLYIAINAIKTIQPMVTHDEEK